MSWTVLFFRVLSFLHIFLPALILAGIIGWITDFYLPFRARWARYPDAFTNLDERQHAERRRIVSRLYSLSSVLQLEERVESCVEMLVERLSERAATEGAIDMAEWIQWYAFDVIGELFFSRKFGFMENAHDHEGYIHALDLLIPFTAVACAMPAYMRPLFLASGAMVPRVFEALRALRHIETASDACVAQRRHDSTRDKAGRRSQGQKDMLDGFFNILRSKGEEKDFTLTEVKMEVYGAFIAGSDTTAAAITAILYHLMRTPSTYDKLTAEIDEATESGALSLPAVQYHEAVGLPYLVACCKEGMRLHPSVGLTLPRHVPAGGCVISGEWFPAGTRVGINAAVVQRDKAIFGEDADELVPERWFRKGAAKMDRMMFQFGSGSRICIGKNISLCEIYKLVPQLLRSFHIRFAEPEREWETRNYWFNKPSRPPPVPSHRAEFNHSLNARDISTTTQLKWMHVKQQSKQLSKISILVFSLANGLLRRQQEDFLVQWILEEDARAFPPSHARAREMANRILKMNGDHKPVGKH
ncbi:hypothetical protein PTNB29_01365 [Pyrenophora teres f. teres]|nr:hypothetical protein PTNB29_01365 [Pyrenophora teres f. teres]